MSPPAPTVALSNRILGMQRRNWQGPPLHPNIKGRSTPASASQMASKDCRGAAPTREESPATDAEPLSSSDEENTQAVKSPATAASPQKTKTTPEQPFVSSPDLATSRATKRQKMSRIRDAGPVVQETCTQSSTPQDDNILADFGASQSSQRKRKQARYGTNRNMSSSSQTRAYNTPPPLPEAMPADEAKRTFSVPAEFVSYSPGRVQCRNKRRLSVRDDPKPSILGGLPIPELHLPPDPGSSSTTTTEMSTMFEVPDLPAENAARRRSDSASSLSSAHSDASLKLTSEEMITSREHDTTETSPVARCPLCEAIVELSHLEAFGNGRKMNVRAQQRFCQEHKEREAKAVADRHGYPDIDWGDLETTRIPKYIQYLTRVLQQEEPSFYRTKLEKIANQPGKRKLRRYLGEDIVDVVKHGYYGPKGAGKISNEISIQMSGVLSKALKNDKLVKATEVGGYVSAVLVPELLVKLVMEDMKVTQPERARQILDQSTELGLSLNGDDDERIVVQAEEE